MCRYCLDSSQYLMSSSPCRLVLRDSRHHKQRLAKRPTVSYRRRAIKLTSWCFCMLWRGRDGDGRGRNVDNVVSRGVMNWCRLDRVVGSKIHTRYGGKLSPPMGRFTLPRPSELLMCSRFDVLLMRDSSVTKGLLVDRWVCLFRVDRLQYPGV